METNRAKKGELKFELRVLPPPTVPPTTWAEARADYKRGPVVSGPEDAIAYFQQYIGGKPKEAFLAMFVDHRNHVLDCVLMQEGTVDHTAVYPREILKKALDLNATGLIFSHNHPAGSLECVFRSKAARRFGGIRPPISVESGHLFRANPAIFGGWFVELK